MGKSKKTEAELAEQRARKNKSNNEKRVALAERAGVAVIGLHRITMLLRHCEQALPATAENKALLSHLRDMRGREIPAMALNVSGFMIRHAEYLPEERTAIGHAMLTPTIKAMPPKPTYLKDHDRTEGRFRRKAPKEAELPPLGGAAPMALDAPPTPRTVALNEAYTEAGVSATGAPELPTADELINVDSLFRRAASNADAVLALMQMGA